MTKHIIAIGGGGFGRNDSTHLIENYLPMITLQKSEDYRKNSEKLLFETTNAIAKINNEINIRINQFNKNEIANIENLRNIDTTLKVLKEEIYANNNNFKSEEIAKELKVLAKTISLIKK